MDKTEKTVIEWLNEAKEQGYEWAQTAIDLVNNGVETSANLSKDNLSPLELVQSLSTAVNSFYWKVTPQGHDFWDKIYNELLENFL